MATASHAPAGQSQVLQQPPATQTTTQTTTQAVLRLRGASRVEQRPNIDGEGENTASSRRIQWAEDVIDNEGLGRKKSKVCCIYHAPKEFGESSDESSSDSDDSESGDDGSARPARKKEHDHDHEHGDGHNHSHDHEKGKGKGRESGRARSPNAYEKMPKPRGLTKEK